MISRLRHRTTITACCWLATLGGCANSTATTPSGARSLTIAGHAAVEYGSVAATTVVVMVHGRTTHKDSWYPLFRQVGSAGYRAVAYDYDATGDADVRAVVQYERAHGTTTIVLMGSSLGAGHALRGGNDATIRAVAVVSISAVAVATTIAPVLAIASLGDGATPANAREIVQRSGHGSESLIVSGSTHGVDLVHPHPEVVSAIIAWLKKTLTN